MHRLGLLAEPGADSGGPGRARVARGADAIDDAIQPPVVDDPPQAGGLIADPNRLAAASLVDSEPRHWRHRRGQLCLDVRDERGVDDRPGHCVRPTAAWTHAASVATPLTTLDPQPRRQA